MNKLEYALGVLDGLDVEVGRSIYDQAVKMKNRRRLESGSTRQKRKRFPWSKYQKLYQKRNGVCWWCQSDMKLIKGQIEVDHFDPNADDFNGEGNLSVLHMDCNREKSAKTLTEQAEYLGITVKELLERFNK